MNPGTTESPPPFGAWFKSRFGEPTPAQTAAWPLIQQGSHTLIVSPTGTGKTLAAFLPVLDRLALHSTTGSLAESIHAIYISPLRALSYDLEKNLATPLREVYGATPPIRIALRTGDTDNRDRRHQWTRPPHILLTTPESLCLLLSQTRWLPHFSTVRWVIVDEVHALAGNKRGAHLSLSLERLTHLQRPQPGPQRIGLSATVAPIDEMASFLAGAGRECRVVDVTTTKRMDLQVYSPLQRDPYPQAGFSGIRMIEELGRLIRRHRTTAIFANTRSGAEATTFWLHEALPDLAAQIECHHGSLDRDLRVHVEDRLKRGELRAVVCSTSLELGIDVGSIDLVVMLATPKGVSRALQRTGRAGHSIHEVSRGLLMATNIGDLIECCATARLARRHHLDTLRTPRAPLDVLAQHLMGLGCIGEWNRNDALHLVRNAWPYRDLPEAAFNDVLDYLAGGGKSLRQQYSETFGKIRLDDTVFEARSGAARRDFLENIGTIPSEGIIHVRLGTQLLGTVEESFLRHLRNGDVFILGGRPVRLERATGMEAWVTHAPGESPTVPRWNASKFPLSNRVAHEIRAFRSELRHKLEHLRFEESPSLIPWIAQRLECDPRNAALIFRLHAAQHLVSEIPTAEALLVEEFIEPRIEPAIPRATAPPTRRSRRQPPPPSKATQLALRLGHLRAQPPSSPTPGGPPLTPPAPAPGHPLHHYFFHSLIGRTANDALSRVIAVRLGRLKGGNAIATADDYGFILTLDATQAITARDLPEILKPGGFDEDLTAAIQRSSLLQHHFRNAAQTGLMVYRNYFGESKSYRKIQWSAEVIFNVLVQHEPDHVLLREARRDAEHSFLDVPRAKAYLDDLAAHGRPLRMKRVSVVPPLSFGMFATRIKEALQVEDPRETLERLYHHWWQKLEGAGIPES